MSDLAYFQVLMAVNILFKILFIVFVFVAKIFIVFEVFGPVFHDFIFGFLKGFNEGF